MQFNEKRNISYHKVPLEDAVIFVCLPTVELDWQSWKPFQSINLFPLGDFWWKPTSKLSGFLWKSMELSRI